MQKLYLIFKAIFHFPMDIWQMFVTYLPGEIGSRLRYLFWKKRLRSLGKNTRIDQGVFFQNPKFIEIGNNCWIDKNVIILAGLDNSMREKIVKSNPLYDYDPGVVYVGDNVHIAPFCIISGISSGVYIEKDCGLSANCKIYAFSNHYRSQKDSSNKSMHFGPLVSHERQCIIEGPVYIGNNTGIALNSVILPGVGISNNSFVAVNSLIVPGSFFEENSLIAGNPAKKIGSRFFSTEQVKYKKH